MTRKRQSKKTSTGRAKAAGDDDQAPSQAPRPSPFTSPAIRMLETRLAVSFDSIPNRPVRCAADVVRLLRELIADADREHFVVVYLNARHVPTHVHIVSRGTTQTAPVHPREVFKGAYLANAAALVIAHNHPSGDVSPSPDDRAVTDRLREASELLGIELLDALIVGPGQRFYSTAEDRILSDPSAVGRDVADGP